MAQKHRNRGPDAT